nr:lasso peptide biosynthesis PqqD family chaperone [Halomonas sp. UBA3074]
MSLALDTLVQRDADILAAVVDEEVVMMSADQGQYYGLSSVGGRIWELTEDPITISDLVQKLCEDYDVEAAECANDTLPFLDSMVKAGLIHIIR